MKRPIAALLPLLLLLLLITGCRQAPAPTPAPAPVIPAGYPAQMVSVTCDESTPDTPLASRTVTYAYETDSEGRVTARTYIIGDVAYRESTAYDEAGRTALWGNDRLENGQRAAGSVLHRYTYDAAGRRLTDTLYAREGEREVLTSRTDFTYGENGRTAEAVMTDENGIPRRIATFTYAADPAALLPPDAVAAFDPVSAVLFESAELTAADGTALGTVVRVYDAADCLIYQETFTAVHTWERSTYDTDGHLVHHETHADGMIYTETYDY